MAPFSNSSASRRAAVADGGFSLVEILVNVVIIGLVAFGVAQTFAIVSRTVPQAESRIEDARSLIGLSIYLPEDLSSTPSSLDDGTGPGGIDVDPTTVTGCAGASPGDNLLRARWTETIGDTTATYYASYRYVAVEGGHLVERHACTAGSPAAVGRMTGVLADSPQCPLGPGERHVSVDLIADTDSSAGGAVFRIHVQCRETEVRGLSNNPNDHLPEPTSDVWDTTTIPTTSVPATTTTEPAVTTTVVGETTTTMAATTTTEPPCTGGAIVSVEPAHASNGSHEDMSELNKDVTITITSSGWCPSLGIVFDPWNANGTPQAHERWYSLQGQTSIRLLGRGGELWSDGLHTIRLQNGVNSTTVLDTEILEVR